MSSGQIFQPRAPPPISASPSGRRPSPQWAQYKRTIYFLRRNTLALIGIGIIVFLVVVAIYATTQPAPWNSLDLYCSTNAGPPVAGCTNICTYPAGSPPPGPGCYQTPNPGGIGYPAVIAPTFTSSPLSAGPLPMGSLTIGSISGQHFYSTYQGLLRGTDWSLFISLTIVIGGAMIGLMVGAIAGFWGGVVDEAIMRIVDIFLSIPQIVFVIVVVAVINLDLAGTQFSSSYTRIYALILSFMIVWWPFYARIVRGQVLVVREQKYVEAARASGASRGRIVRKHIIPNSMYPVFIQMSLDVGTIPLLVGVLVFLQFQILPVVNSGLFPEWGAMSAYSVGALSGVLEQCEIGACVIPWWQFLFPGLALFLFAISVNFVSDGLRDALDPRLRR